MRMLVAGIAWLVVLGCSIGSAEESGGKSTTASGVFTAEQAADGERAYQSHCSACHGDELRGNDPESGDLTDGAFKFQWVGKTVGTKFEQIRSTMPRENARSLSDQMYIDIVAYILKFNGVQSGKQRLEPNPAVLNKIVIAP